MVTSGTADTSSPLIEEDIVNGSVDYKGRPVTRSTSGGWRSASFIIAAEVAERFAYYGIFSNLISYLTGSLGQSTAAAAANANLWAGTATLLPILGAIVADSFLGRFCTIIVASLTYILGLGLLTVSAALTSKCENTNEPCSTPWFQVNFFFFSLYLVAVGQGGHKPCLQAFGADQFDGRHPKESRAKSSFFNWYYFIASAGVNSALLAVVYIQENFGWVFGFGIPVVAMIAALVVFLLGTTTYRCNISRNWTNPLARFGQACIRAMKNQPSTPSIIAAKEEAHLCGKSSDHFNLNKEVIALDESMEGEVSCVSDVDETKAFFRLIPIWITSLPYAIVFAQTTTFFLKQGVTLDRYILPGYQIPAASLQTFIGVAIVIIIPTYDCIFVPFARSLSGNPNGITVLQRIGTGMFVSVLSMLIAALVEKRRLETAREYGLVNLPNATVPMAIWWLVPQYVLCGIANVFSIVGLQEFFYDQVPEQLRSVGLSLYLSVIGVGSFLSSFLVSVLDKATAGDGKESWFSNNLNKAHLDYFYGFLAGLNLIGLIAYLICARLYRRP